MEVEVSVVAQDLVGMVLRTVYLIVGQSSMSLMVLLCKLVSPSRWEGM